MLDSLYVRNLALIDKAEVCFTEGLNVLSGETGAGKSIIIGSVLIALGAKVPKDMIRTGEKEGYIELVFSIKNQEIKEKLAALDIYPEDDQIIVSRRITTAKSVCKINGETLPASKVREAAAYLIDVHGQRDHQALLRPGKQLEIVDRNGGGILEAAKQKHHDAYIRWRGLRDELASYEVDEDERIRRMDILRYEINELEEADIHPGEAAILEAQWKELSSRELIYSSCNEGMQLLGYDSGACSSISLAQKCMQSLHDAQNNAQDILNQLMDAESIITDAVRQMEEMIKELEDDERDPDEIEKRMDAIQHLMQKYRSDEQGLLDILKTKSDELEKYTNFEEEKLRISKSCESAERKMIKTSEELTLLRKNSAAALAVMLKEALLDLNFLDVRFDIAIEENNEIGINGKDTAIFCIAANPGEEIRPMAQIASGGELSRIMLAIKSVLAKREEIETLIFDEIDTGISGRTAQKVAHRLVITSETSQVICISHLAQIVSMADTHFLIEKSASESSTATHISRLSEEESVTEIARLLGGEEITQNVIDTAREMKDMASRAKEYQITK